MSQITLKHVAAKAGVSYQTVSKVLNHKATVAPDTEARIWQAIQELNYRPNVSAQNLRTQASNLIGFAWSPVSHDGWNPIHDAFLHCLVDEAEARGQLITLFDGGVQGDSCVRPYADLYARRQVNGFVLANTVQDDPRIAFLVENDIPFVSFGRSNEAWDFCWVDVDGRAGIQSVMAHLKDRGHTRVGLVTWQSRHTTRLDREEGYRRGLQAMGVAYDDDFVVSGADSAETGAKAMEHFAALAPARRPTAVVCISDQIAIGAMHAAVAGGLHVGRASFGHTAIAITGYDDVPMARYLYPRLTTVEQPIRQVSRQIVELLLKQLQDEPISQKGVMIKPRLIIRESS